MADDWIELTLEEWQAQGVQLFGRDVNKWRFVCPACGHIQTRQDWLNLGMRPQQVDERVGFTCIGRWLDPFNMAKDFEPSGGSGCNYVGDREPNISPFTVIISPGEERPTFGWDISNAD